MRYHYIQRGRHYVLMRGAQLVGITTDRNEAVFWVETRGEGAV